MNRLRTSWKLGLAALLAIIAIQTGISLLVRTVRVRNFLTRQLQISFGRDVEVRQFSATLFPTPQLDAYGVSVGEDPAFGQEYFLRAEQLSAGLRWTGILRGRFELGTLRLQRASLILVRNGEGRWNLERWLPAAIPNPAESPQGKQESRERSAYHLQRIDINDGRVNFKLGDNKTSFAFLQVSGSVEQTAAGRWTLNLNAEPWRSGVPLQLAGMVRVRGEVAGTSARLQPARIQMSWEKSSLADVFRLIGGRDFGVRGLFAAELTAASTGPLPANDTKIAKTKWSPGDWVFTVRARASGIHRWDLTERTDNPRIALRANGRWNPAAGTMNADELVVESPFSNLRGTASLSNMAEPNLELRMDSAGVQAADLLDWYRAFRPGVAEDIHAVQYFTGAAIFRGWPLSLEELAFSSPGGRWTMPGFGSPVDVRTMRGGTHNQRLAIEPFAVSVPIAKTVLSSSRALGGAASLPGPSSVGSTANVSLAHDFSAKSGGIHVEGQTTRVQDIFAIASAFGRPLQNGWELRGKAAADLRWEWSAGNIPTWSGHADVTQAVLHVAGLNQPAQIESVRAEWRNGVRKFTLGNVSAFGAAWSGSVEQPRIVPSEFGETEIAPWSFQLQADRLDATELDRWIGPRARPGWLQRLLPSAFGGTSKPELPSALLRRIRASGELRVDQLTVEKIKLTQFHAQAKLDALKLSLQNIQTHWLGGEVRGSVEAAFSAKPQYQIAASFDRISISQTPWLTQLSDRLAGTAYGRLELRAAGIGREALLSSLDGKGEIGLTNVELRGWDLAGTMSQGEWKAGTSHWNAGTGKFHLTNGGFDLNSLRLTSPAGDFLLKGSISFAEHADLTAESHVTERNARPESTVRFMQISGPLAEPKVSFEKATAQQPGD